MLTNSFCLNQTHFSNNLHEESVTDTSETWTKFYAHPRGQITIDQGEKIKILQKGLKDWDVVMDSPTHVIWYEILLAFPNAKVIFHERPIDEWYPSFVKQMLSLRTVPALPDRLQEVLIDNLNPSLDIWITRPTSTFQTFFFGHNVYPYKDMKSEYAALDEIFIKRNYRQHNADVLTNCPAEKLLVLETMNCGWKVICEFTGDELPMEKSSSSDGEMKIVDWPHKNKNCAVTAELFGTEDDRDTRLMRHLVAEQGINFKKCLKTGLKRMLVGGCFVGCAVAVYKNHEMIEGNVAKVIQNLKN